MKKQPYDQNTLVDLTEDQIEAYKKEYGEIFVIELDGKKCFLHKPNRQILDAANLQKKSSAFNETLLKNCWIAGDKEFVTHDEFFFPACKRLDELITFKDAELKKL
ncbi:MAG: hypothetical protein U1C59_14590 [Methylotenera sp.]|nr:hypothetical protein [Methylotenera sp.]